MSRTSKITALYKRLSRVDDLTGMQNTWKIMLAEMV